MFERRRERMLVEGDWGMRRGNDEDDESGRGGYLLGNGGG